MHSHVYSRMFGISKRVHIRACFARTRAYLFVRTFACACISCLRASLGRCVCTRVRVCVHASFTWTHRCICICTRVLGVRADASPHAIISASAYVWSSLLDCEAPPCTHRPHGTPPHTSGHAGMQDALCAFTPLHVQPSCRLVTCEVLRANEMSDPGCGDHGRSMESGVQSL